MRWQPRGNRKWYGYSYNQLINPSSPEEFNNNRLRSITYNYDRSLDWFIYTALKTSFDLTDDRAASVASSLPIHHVHGAFGARPYEPTWRGFIEQSHGLHIVSNDIERSGVLEKCAHLLAGAKTIIFLGFGYDPVNLGRLRLGTFREADFHGTMFGLTDSEADVHKGWLRANTGIEIQAAATDVDCLRFLREHRQLFG